MTKPDDSHIDEMREAIRGDFERSRRSAVLSQQLAAAPAPRGEPAVPAPRRRRFWRR